MFPKKIWLFKRQTNWDKGRNLIINDNSCLLGKKNYSNVREYLTNLSTSVNLYNMYIYTYA